MLRANDSKTEAERMLLSEVEMVSFLSVCHEFCPSARLVPTQTSCGMKKKKKWCFFCSFFSACSNLSAWYQSLKCPAVVLLRKHNTAEVNSVALQRKDRRINTGSKVAITFLHSEKFVPRNGSSWMGEGNREDSDSLAWNNWGLKFYLLQEKSWYFKSSVEMRPPIK